MTANTAIVFAFAAVLFLTREGHADATLVDPAQAQPVFDRVTELLTGQGFAVKRDLVPVYMTAQRRPGETRGGAIYIDSGRPFDCFDSDLAHEATHVLLGRDVGMTPAQSEPFARAVDVIVAGNNRNCATRN